MKKWIFFIPLAVLAGLSGCATLPTPPAKPSSGESLWRQVEDHTQAVQSLKGLAQVQVTSTAKKFTVQEILLIRRPASLRAESLSPLGIPQLYLVTDGQEVTIYLPAENRYYRGPATADRLSSILPVALEPAEAVTLLLGSPPLGTWEEFLLREDPGEGLWVLELSAPERPERLTLWIDPPSGRILRAESRRPGAHLRFSFSDFQKTGGVLFPRRIELESLSRAVRLLVQYQEVEINPGLGAQDFHLPVPRGAVRLPWP